VLLSPLMEAVSNTSAALDGHGLRVSAGVTNSRMTESSNRRENVGKDSS
jgi:hypothetical protein